MAEASVEVEGWEDVERLLRRKIAPEVFRRALRRLAEEVKLRAIPYPTEGPWNTPGPYPARWYQRHFGPRWARKGGGYGGRDTSERMLQQWFVAERSATAVEVGNRASYAGYVMGEEQAPFHGAHGWAKLRDIAEDVVGEQAADFLRQEIERA